MNSPVMRTDQAKKGLIDLCEYVNNRKRLNSMTMIEIGCYEGDSTEIFAQRFKEVIAIDPWESGIGDITDRVNMDNVYQTFIKKIGNYENVFIKRDFSYNVAPILTDDHFDFIYIDGGHTYEDVFKDIKCFYSKMKKGSFICGHDYRQKFNGVIKAVNELLGKPMKVFSDTSWLCIKK